MRTADTSLKHNRQIRQGGKKERGKTDRQAGVKAFRVLTRVMQLLQKGREKENQRKMSSSSPFSAMFECSQVSASKATKLVLHLENQTSSFPPSEMSLPAPKDDTLPSSSSPSCSYSFFSSTLSRNKTKNSERKRQTVAMKKPKEMASAALETENGKRMVVLCSSSSSSSKKRKNGEIVGGGKDRLQSGAAEEEEGVNQMSSGSSRSRRTSAAASSSSSSSMCNNSKHNSNNKNRITSTKSEDEADGSDSVFRDDYDGTSRCVDNIHALDALLGQREILTVKAGLNDSNKNSNNKELLDDKRSDHLFPAGDSNNFPASSAEEQGGKGSLRHRRHHLLLSSGEGGGGGFCCRSDAAAAGAARRRCWKPSRHLASSILISLVGILLLRGKKQMKQRILYCDHGSSANFCCRNMSTREWPYNCAQRQKKRVTN